MGNIIFPIVETFGLYHSAESALKRELSDGQVVSNL